MEINLLKELAKEIYKEYRDELSGGSLDVIISLRIRRIGISPTPIKIQFVREMIAVMITKGNILNEKEVKAPQIRNEDKTEIGFDSLFKDPKMK